MSAAEVPVGPAQRGDPDVVVAFGTEGDSASRQATAAETLMTGCSVVLCTFERPAAVRQFLESLLRQVRRPDELIVVDASHDDRTEPVVRELAAREGAPRYVAYYRVSGRYRGLTRQRNFALRRVSYDLVAFFDDDTVLEASCLAEMENAHRFLADRVVGVGAVVTNESPEPNRLWRLRRALRLVPDLKPGRYCRSGLSIPWSFLPQGEGLAEGDCLPGCAMMWKTAPAREVKFHEGFAGYAQAEDLDFSLRMRHRGRLVIACGARLEHLQESKGRPNNFLLGYMSIYNRYQIHRRCLADRRFRDIVWFTYAWSVDTLLLVRHVFYRRRWLGTLQQLAGRFKALFDLLLGRSSA